MPLCQHLLPIQPTPGHYVGNSCISSGAMDWINGESRVEGLKCCPWLCILDRHGCLFTDFWGPSNAILMMFLLLGNGF